MAHTSLCVAPKQQSPPADASDRRTHTEWIAKTIGSMLKSMRRGVIVSDAGGMHEVINDKCGVVINRGSNMKKQLKDKLLNLITDHNLRSEMSREAKIQAKNFTDIKFYRSLVKTLNNIEQ